MSRLLRSTQLLLLASAVAGDAMRYTCAPGGNESNLPFCDRSLGFSARAADLAKRLSLEDHVALFFSYPGTPYIPSLNIKGWSLDHTCIHGVNKQHGVSSFPHAIAQGASFDTELVARVSNATAIEARILSVQGYESTRGQNQGTVLSCDGGPLANTAHDPRWGRICETYGEDPVLVQTMGTVALQGLQNPQEVAGGKPGDAFLATRQVTRHYIGYHSARDDIHGGTFNATKRTLADSYLPTYAVFQDPTVGAADGIMCAMSELFIEDANITQASCASNFLLSEQLRDEWKSDAIIQSDCCDSVRTMNNPFHYQGITSDEQALALAVNAGMGVYFGFAVGELKQAMSNLLGNKTVSEATIRAAGQRVLLSHLKLGFFDSYKPDFPFSNSTLDWSLLGGAKHTALAREAAAKSTVLLKNAHEVLPLQAKPNKKLAVVGPFAECEDFSSKQAQNGTCYLQSYNGFPDVITTIRAGLFARAAAVGWGTEYAIGSNATCPGGGRDTSSCWEQQPQISGAITEAAAAATRADVTVLCLGLGSSVEAEGNDRVNMTLPLVQQELLSQVSSAVKSSGSKLVVVVVSAGGVDLGDVEMDMDAILYAPYGGQEAGSGLADVLFGDINPSARLPVTVYRQEWSDLMNAEYSTSIMNLNLEIGAGRTARYLQDEKYVRHSFGFGLSYSKFEYSAVSAVRQSGGDVLVAATLKNTGSLDGDEVAQVWASGPPSHDGLVVPTRNLVAFGKYSVRVGGSVEVKLLVPASQLQTAQADGSRKLLPGTYTISVGGHQPQDQEGTAGSSGACVTTHLTLN